MKDLNFSDVPLPTRVALEVVRDAIRALEGQTQALEGQTQALLAEQLAEYPSLVTYGTTPPGVDVETVFYIDTVAELLYVRLTTNPATYKSTLLT